MVSYRKTKEVLDKWKRRIKNCIINEQKKVPIGHGQILSEYFKKYGAKILFSYEEDNDDTLASYASEIENVFILSGDHDFYRYNYKFVPVIFKNFHYVTYKNIEYINFERHINMRPNPNTKLRKVIYPLPKTRINGPIIDFLKRDKIWSRGIVTELCKEFGNFHTKIRRLRQALYYKIFEKDIKSLDEINSKLKYNNNNEDKNKLLLYKKNLEKKLTITEIFPVWNGNNVMWTKTKVKPNKKELNLITNNLKKTINKYFPEKYLKKILSYFKNKYDKDEANLRFSNALFSINAIVVEIKCLITNTTFLEEISKLYNYNYY